MRRGSHLDLVGLFESLGFGAGGVGAGADHVIMGAATFTERSWEAAAAVPMDSVSDSTVCAGVFSGGSSMRVRRVTCSCSLTKRLVDTLPASTLASAAIVALIEASIASSKESSESNAVNSIDTKGGGGGVTGGMCGNGGVGGIGGEGCNGIEGGDGGEGGGEGSVAHVSASCIAPPRPSLIFDPIESPTSPPQSSVSGRLSEIFVGTQT